MNCTTNQRPLTDYTNQKARSSSEGKTLKAKTLYQARKVHNITKEMDRLTIGVLSINETRWSGPGQCLIEVYYPGTDTDVHRHGVIIIVGRIVQMYFTNFVPVSKSLDTTNQCK
ncbi:hypothetical protein Trydic_g12591 [Trypoxylus dichotomus]